MHIKKVAEPSTKNLAEAEGDVLKAKNDFMTDLNNFLTERARAKTLLATLMGLETMNDPMSSDDYLKPTTAFKTGSEFFLEKKVKVPSGMPKMVPGLQQLGYPAKQKW